MIKEISLVPPLAYTKIVSEVRLPSTDYGSPFDTSCNVRINYLLFIRQILHL